LCEQRNEKILLPCFSQKLNLASKEMKNTFTMLFTKAKSCEQKNEGKEINIVLPCFSKKQKISPGFRGIFLFKAF
jgi:hypothetical protein